MQKIESLQGLRFILFVNIFLFHLTAFEEIKETVWYNVVFSGMGCFAVCAFFILSGFVADLEWKEDNRQME